MINKTYLLKLNGKDSENYYSVIRKLADEIILYSSGTIAPIIRGYKNYINSFGLEQAREDEEYILELLSFGILWRIYSPSALAVKFAPYTLLMNMSEYRKKHPRIKPYIDIARGILTTLFLLPNKVKVSDKKQFPSLEMIDKTCIWFEATGEFKEEALRFIRWRAYWGTLKQERLKEIFSGIRTFVNWFEDYSFQMLGQYTEDVDTFTSMNKSKYKWREDRISCLRIRLEYHLNMAGAELLNRAFRKDFINTEITDILLPGCMRNLENSKCKAVKELKGLKCIGCNINCRVNKIRTTGIENNFGVYIIPHASDLSLWSTKEGEIRRGVIASACVSNLVEGGWELKRYDVPAQCVLLDYCGCSKHWFDNDIQTELNIMELKRKLNNWKKPEPALN